MPRVLKVDRVEIDKITSALAAATPSGERLPIAQGGSPIDHHGFTLFEDRLDSQQRWFLPRFKAIAGVSAGFSFAARKTGLTSDAGEEIVATITIPLKKEVCPPLAGFTLSEISLPDLVVSLAIRVRTDGVEQERSLTGHLTTGAASTAGGATFAVELTSAGSNKIDVIKALRELFGHSLRAAKELVMGVPVVLATGQLREQADKIVQGLTAVGAVVNLKDESGGSNTATEVVAVFEVTSGFVRAAHHALAVSGSAEIVFSGSYAGYRKVSKGRRFMLLPRRIPKVKKKRPFPRLPRGHGDTFDPIDPPELDEVEEPPPPPVEVQLPPAFFKGTFAFQSRGALFYDCRLHGGEYTLAGQGAPVALGCTPPTQFEGKGRQYQEIPAPTLTGVAKVYRSLVSPAVALVVPSQYAVGQAEGLDVAPARAYQVLDASDEDQSHAAFDFTLVPQLSATDRDLIGRVLAEHIPVPPGEQMTTVWPFSLGPDRVVSWNDGLAPRPVLTPIRKAFYAAIGDVSFSQLAFVNVLLAAGIFGQMSILVEEGVTETVTFRLGGPDANGQPLSLDRMDLDTSPVDRAIVVQTGIDFAARHIARMDVDVTMVAGKTTRTDRVSLTAADPTDAATFLVPFDDALRPAVFTYTVRIVHDNDAPDIVRGPFELRTWATVVLTAASLGL